MPAVLALPELLLLAALIVAYGLIRFGGAFIEALFWILNNTLGKIPFVGGKIKGLSDVAYQKLANALGTAADGISAAIAKSWNFLAQIIDRTGWAIWHLALAVHKIEFYLRNPVWMAKLLIRTSPFVLAFRWIREHLNQTTTNVTHVTKIVNNAATGTIGGAIRVTVKQPVARIAHLEKWTRAQIARLEHAIAHTGGTVIRLPGAGAADLRGVVAKLRARLSRIEAGVLPYIAAGVFVATLSRFGLDWLRCRNVKSLGRGVCRMDTTALDALLVGSTVIVGGISIRALASELSGAMDEATGYLTAFVREAPKR